MPETPILYGPDGQPIKREVMTRAIAGPSIAGVRSPLTGYPGDGLNPRRLASLLKQADQGEPLRFFELAEQIEERDPHYAGVLGARKRQVAQLDITVEAASDDADAVAQADMVRDWLTRDELQGELFDMLDAIGKGASFVEIVWDTSGGDWRPDRLEWRDPRWFLFDPKDGTTPLLRADPAEAAAWSSANAGFGGVPLPPFKFVQCVIRAKSGLPVRSGIARLATWNWMFKAFASRDWAIFTQTYGQPVRVGKYKAGATEDDKDTLFKAVANIAGDCAAIIPESMLIEFVQTTQLNAGSELYRERVDFLDKQISKAVLGQTGTTDATPGQLGGSQDHTEVREDIERADAIALAGAINRDLVRPWVDLQFGPQKKYPKVKIGRREEKNIQQTVDGVVKLVPFGLKVQASEMRDMLGLSEPEDDAELLTAPAPAPSIPFGTPADNFSARALQAAQDTLAMRDADAVARLAADAERLAQPATDDLIDQVRAVVERATSLPALQAELAKLELAPDKLAAALRMALVMAQLSGRADLAEEVSRS